jgi:predicted HicB family RNase H-like nuclease
MATEETVVLATRIPKSLHRQIKLYCAQNDISIREFVVAALEHIWNREQGQSAARRKPER